LIPSRCVIAATSSRITWQASRQEVTCTPMGSNVKFIAVCQAVWRVDRAELSGELERRFRWRVRRARAGPDRRTDGHVLGEVDEAAVQARQLQCKTLEKPSIDENCRTDSEGNPGENPVSTSAGISCPAGPRIREFVNHNGIPVSDADGESTLPDTTPEMMADRLLGTKFINEMRNARLHPGLGTSFKECDSSSWYPITLQRPPTKLIHIDIDLRDRRNYPDGNRCRCGSEEDADGAQQGRQAALSGAAQRTKPSSRKSPGSRRRSRKQQGRRGKQSVPDESAAHPRRSARGGAEGPADRDRRRLNKNGIGSSFVLYRRYVHHPGGFAHHGLRRARRDGVKIGAPDKTVIRRRRRWRFGQNRQCWPQLPPRTCRFVIVHHDNNAYGTIAGLIKAHYDTTFGTVFSRNGEEYAPGLRGDRTQLRHRRRRIQRAEDSSRNWKKRSSETGRSCWIAHGEHPDAHRRPLDIMNVFSPGQEGAPRCHQLTRN